MSAPPLPNPLSSHLDEHRLEVLLARVHVPLQVLVDPLEDQPQLRVAVHAVLSNQAGRRGEENNKFPLLIKIKANTRAMSGGDFLSSHHTHDAVQARTAAAALTTSWYEICDRYGAREQYFYFCLYILVLCYTVY